MLEKLYADPFLDPVNMTPLQMREAFDVFYADLGVPWAQADVQEAQFDVDGGVVRLRIYRPPEAPGELPIILFYLGGGLVMGSHNSYDTMCRRLCLASQAVVVSVAYRRPPEHPFPAAVDDSYAALLWARDNAKRFGGDAGRMAVAGESGGGMLAAVVAHLAKDQGGPKLALQLLMYPAVGTRGQSQSMQTFAEGYWFEPGQLDWLYSIYAPDADVTNPLISPTFRRDFSDLPPAYVIVAEQDILRDDVMAYAEDLRRAGVAVQLTSYDTIHGFICMGAVIDAASEALDRAGEALVAAFSEASE
ncbi:alpha/beta hydrolase [Phenylobacterium sp. Root700]|uniref:alpha/beta hydrolase n=1 Tax=Phenylobacterium sp. Root700 TaxID=1736591 RepID=UPI000AFFFAD3|nr:alpha/beta hydrolase [Phenylobacterium sp. Root700]